ncbi:hypothetical protein [Candidatus Uabimicrobium sp. HlEnr_7]|uniref:hypothetical protein n=1 Tax=Candidatus Uabimicrobium helgolandensis TaxID=3095367 RepID=UPI003558EEC8
MNNYLYRVTSKFKNMIFVATVVEFPLSLFVLKVVLAKKILSKSGPDQFIPKKEEHEHFRNSKRS